MKNQSLTSQALKSKPKRKEDGILNTGSVRRLIGVCVLGTESSQVQTHRVEN